MDNLDGHFIVNKGLCVVKRLDYKLYINHIQHSEIQLV